MSKFVFETDTTDAPPPAFGGPADVLVHFMSLAFSTRYGSQHDLSRLALLLRGEYGIDLGPLTTFADRDVEEDADARELERAWQDAAPLASCIRTVVSALDSGDDRIAALTSESPDLRDRLAYPPGHLHRKVYILDEAHQITKDAWNALLKSLEEPPDFVIFMFASTEPSGFPPAILSRLQRYDVRRLTIPEIEGKLQRILEADGRTAEPGAITLVAHLAAGGMRDAESILDQLLSTSTDTITESMVRDLLGLADAAAVDGFLDALLTGDAAKGIDILDRLEERGRDPRALLDQVVEAVRRRLVEGAARSDLSADAALTTVAQRLVAIDPDRAGIGGLRLQLELALFAAASDRMVGRTAATSPVMATPPAATTEPDQRPTRPTPVEPPPSAPPTPAPGPVPTATVGPPPEQPASPSSEPVPTGAGPEVDALVAGWPDIVKAVSPATRAVLTECRPIAVDGNVVTLGFPEAKAFLKDHAERRKTDVEAAIGGHLGRPVSVRAVATNIEVAPLAAADDLVAEARRIFAEDLVDVGEVT